MPEWEKYFERAGESLSSAKLLFEAGKYNHAVSEAYYAQYYAAKALLSVRYIQAKKHKGVLAMLTLEFVNKNLLSLTRNKKQSTTRDL